MTGPGWRCHCTTAVVPPCPCSQSHRPRRIVLTGGPGAGKTAVLELARQALCSHVRMLGEAAGILFHGGFPRQPSDEARRATQRAIYAVQRELETIGELDHASLVLCDRGTIDGAAYWRGDGDLFSAVGTTLDAELRRYDAVIHLRVPDPARYNHDNPLRVESAAEAAVIDRRLLDLWSRHPRHHVVAATADFLDKARAALAILADQVPACCRGDVTAR
jgi:predicted ATPase